MEASYSHIQLLVTIQVDLGCTDTIPMVDTFLQQTFVTIATVAFSFCVEGRVGCFMHIEQIEHKEPNCNCDVPLHGHEFKMHCTTMIIVNDDMAARKVSVITN